MKPRPIVAAGLLLASGALYAAGQNANAAPDEPNAAPNAAGNTRPNAGRGNRAGRRGANQKPGQRAAQTARQTAPMTGAATGAATTGVDGPLPTGGVSLLGADPLSALQLKAPQGAAKIERVQAANPAGGEVLRLSTLQRVNSDTGIALVADIADSIAPSDTLFIRFWARTLRTEDEAAVGRMAININSKTATAEPSAFFPGLQAAPPGEWQRYDFPRTSRRNFGPNDATLVLGFGKTEAQTIEIAGLQVLNYKSAVMPSQLPFMRETYPGREANAPWRKAAQERIEKYRKGDLAVRVVDAQGRPVRGATVGVKMTRQAYDFGTLFEPNWVAGKGADAQKNREMVPKLFNTIVMSGTKWDPWQNPAQRETTLNAIRWAREQGMRVRGHVLIWPAWRRMPKNVKARYDETKAAQGEAPAQAELRATILAHMTDAVTQTRGLINDWDVVNEPKSSMDVLNLLGPATMADWFKTAHAANPDALLCLNHNAILSGGNLQPVMDYVKLIRERGGPISGVNEEGHTRPMSLDKVLANLDTLATLKLPIQITEYDFVSPDEQLKADWTRDYMTLMFSHPSTTGFLMWGHWDGKHWLGDAPIFYKDWSLKPAGQAYMDLVLKQWRTDATSTTDGQGAAKTRAFTGDYQVTVTHKGKTQTLKTSLPRDGRALTVTLP